MDENLKTQHLQYGFDRQDRDLLIRLNTRVEDLITSLAKKDDQIARDIGGLQQAKLDKNEFSTHVANDAKDFEIQEKELATMWDKYDNHDKDIKSLNKYLWFGMGILAIIQFAAPFIISYLGKKI